MRSANHSLKDSRRGIGVRYPRTVENGEFDRRPTVVLRRAAATFQIIFFRTKLKKLGEGGRSASLPLRGWKYKCARKKIRESYQQPLGILGISAIAPGAAELKQPIRFGDSTAPPFPVKSVFIAASSSAASLTCSQAERRASAQWRSYIVVATQGGYLKKTQSKEKKNGSEKKRAGLPGWQPMIDHISDTWQKKRHADFGYPFTGKDMADLRYFASKFQTWAIAALWDEYLENADDWTMKHGCDIFTFTRNLPRLMDSRTYKGIAAGYEKRWAPPLPKEITDLFSGFKITSKDASKTS